MRQLFLLSSHHNPSFKFGRTSNLTKGIIQQQPKPKQSLCWNDKQYQRFSTSASNTQKLQQPQQQSKKNNPQENVQNIISKTLYKQLLKWSTSTGFHVPFDPIPPLTLIPPRIDPKSLQLLAQTVQDRKSIDLYTDDDKNDTDEQTNTFQQLARLLPSNSIVEDSRLTVPIENAKNVYNVTKLVYKLNHLNDDTKKSHQKNNEEERLEILKKRTTLGFDVLRSLNQLSELLEERKKVREDHKDRSQVLFQVGQVVQHKTERWRAVILGWDKVDLETNSDDDDETSKNPVTKSTSLTHKKYRTAFGEDKKNTSSDDEIHHQQQQTLYNLHVDENDATFSRVRIMGSMTAYQHELEAVQDPDLLRLRNPFISQTFVGFDSKRGRFHPNSVLEYEYPADDFGIGDGSSFGSGIITGDPEMTDEDAEDMFQTHVHSKSILKGVRDIAAELMRTILDSTSCAKERKLDLLQKYEEKLDAIIVGDVYNDADVLTSGGSGSPLYSSEKLAIRHLAALVNVTFEIMEMMWQRRISRQNKGSIQYPLGTLVKHKLYNFRGVVVGWDPYPKTDVSRWDGLSDVKGDINEMPFYHIKPDTNDTVEAFGAARSFRYVCEENLHICPDGETAGIDINMEGIDDWEVNSDSSSSMKYIPPQEAKFRHAESLGEIEDVVGPCMQKITDDISKLLPKELSSDSLFHLLQHTDNPDDAFIIEETIKEIWKMNKNEEVRWRLDDGTAALLRNDKLKALSIFDDIVENEDEKCFEAWNKKATCHYLLGEMEKSIEAAEISIKYCPEHYQAFSGLGLVYNDTNAFRKSAEAYRKSLKLNPWSRVACRLCVLLDTLKRLDLSETVSESNQSTK